MYQTQDERQRPKEGIPMNHGEDVTEKTRSETLPHPSGGEGHGDIGPKHRTSQLRYITFDARMVAIRP